VLVSCVAAGEEGACYTWLNEKCESPGEDWECGGKCDSVHGGYRGNTNNLHRIIVDDFTDSMNYLLMSTAFSTDRTNRMGFSKHFMEQSDKMWGRGKDLIKYVLKRGGKMGTGFQIPPFGTNTRIGDYDYSNEMKALGVNLDMLKERAEDVIKAYRHSLSTKSDGSSPFDPTTAHKLEELSEEYSGDINQVARKLNILGKMVRKSNTNAMGLHLFDQSLL